MNTNMLLGENEMSLSRRWTLAGGENRTFDSVCCNCVTFAQSSPFDLTETYSLSDKQIYTKYKNTNHHNHY